MPTARSQVYHALGSAMKCNGRRKKEGYVTLSLIRHFFAYPLISASRSYLASHLSRMLEIDPQHVEGCSCVSVF
jgi:hypothetical protein